MSLTIYHTISLGASVDLVSKGRMGSGVFETVGSRKFQKAGVPIGDRLSLKFSARAAQMKRGRRERNDHVIVIARLRKNRQVYSFKTLRPREGSMTV